MTEFEIDTRQYGLSMQRLAGRHKGRTHVNVRHGRKELKCDLTDQDLIRVFLAGLAEISKPEHSDP